MEKFILRYNNQRKYVYNGICLSVVRQTGSGNPACWAFQPAEDTDVPELAAWNWLRRESITATSSETITLAGRLAAWHPVARF
jgi:hypothetical protein